TPWLARKRVASDPTPRNPLMLGLMALDSSPSLYLGRPCYHGFSETPACDPLLWTHRRYSAQVVDSMTAALRNYLRNHNHSRLVFCGHSGGGTLAVMLASRFPETVAVITLAGNLDIDRWIRYHGYSPLEGSKNPAKLPPLASGVKEIHYVGEKDTNVLPEFVVPRSRSRAGIEVSIVKDFDHNCCWDKIWSSVLNQLADY
ncbi:MAG: alpha/beta fold hydrolase, partial [Methylococcales bacterium]